MFDTFPKAIPDERGCGEREGGGVDLETNAPVYDVLIWVGAEHYPEATDYIEETRRLGASRRINPQLDLSRLTCRSRMLLAHPRAIIASWQDLIPPERCKKRLPYHDQ